MDRWIDGWIDGFLKIVEILNISSTFAAMFQRVLMDFDSLEKSKS